MSQNIVPRIVLLKWLLGTAKPKTTARGFTLVELLVVIIIGGILSAIALPSFVSRAKAAKETEARVYVGSANKAQQAYYMERSQFTGSFSALGLGVPTTSQHYVYDTAIGTDAGVSVANTTADQIDPALRSVSGQVWTGVSGNGLLTFAISCVGDAGDPPPTITNHQCP